MVVAAPLSGAGGGHRDRSGNVFGASSSTSMSESMPGLRQVRETQFCLVAGCETQLHNSVAQGRLSPGWLWGQAALCHLKVGVMLPGKGWPVKRILQFLALVPNLQIYNFI